MATSGLYTFNPGVSDFTDESFERCGLDPAKLTARHLLSARRSMNLLLSDWTTDGVKQWKVDLQTQATTIGMASFTPAAGTIDIFDMVLRRDSIDTPMERISRDDYMVIPSKTQQGIPDRFFLDRGTTQTCYIWQCGENTTDSIRYNRLVRIQDVGSPSNTVDITPHWFEAFASGLASKLAEKWAPDKEQSLTAKAARAFMRARGEDRDRTDVTIRLRGRR